MGKEILYFGSETCGPCRKLHPVIKDIADTEGVKYREYILQSHKDYFDKYKITGLPTVIIEEDGKELKRFLGLHKVGEYLEALDSNYDYS